MNREDKDKSFIIWLEEIWEEIEIQFYGITFAIFFFFLMYVFFHPFWMRPLIDFFQYQILSLLKIQKNLKFENLTFFDISVLKFSP